ncbi:Oidioi.mRNA.OKI2018_I69.XSR.g14193.t1.cds [Oikopleura dioica]|uniref:Oidioi.mRNA.OKI2018_I69.XSR.g14193.t1.cds n=1 Tax=Oikopleura dioica TaxID=34765 RepID=A0ABN7SDZ5_OIKDI|nr:Oidioi.mRNA.OKI2018_I69.XSR.g14193.t1.cds [Oikopleura dioica]
MVNQDKIQIGELNRMVTVDHEFNNRAKQWQDVAAFEQNELAKVRIHRSLRHASRALACSGVATVVATVTFIELEFDSAGEMTPPQKHYSGKAEICEYKWENSQLNFGNATGGDGSQERLKFLLKFYAQGYKAAITLMTIMTLILIWWYSELERRLLVLRRQLPSESTILSFSPLAFWFYLELAISSVHVPIFNVGLPKEMQLMTFLRLYHLIKYMREHHPMRYNRMTEILKNLGSVTMSSSFLLKSHFLKRPLTMLAGVYFFNVFAMGYVIYALERSYGTCMEYSDVVWLMAVTLTNLGSIVAVLSLFGLFQTALIVGVLSESLLIGPEEKRLMASVERQRAHVIRRKCAARLIQFVWRQYKCRMLMEQMAKKDETEEFIAKLGRRRERMKLAKATSEALWQWRQVKKSTETAELSLEKEFQVDETAITTTHISRKLDSLENLVRRGGQFLRKKSSQSWLTNAIKLVNEAEHSDCDEPNYPKDSQVDLEGGHHQSWASNFFQSGLSRFRPSRYSTRSSGRRTNSLSRRRTTLVTTRASPSLQRRQSENNSDPGGCPKRPSVGSIGRLNTMAAGLPEIPYFPAQNRTAVTRRLHRVKSVDYAVDPPLAQTDKALLYKNTVDKRKNSLPLPPVPRSSDTSSLASVIHSISRQQTQVQDELSELRKLLIQQSSEKSDSTNRTN